jgi:hypothetical protein
MSTIKHEQNEGPNHRESRSTRSIPWFKIFNTFLVFFYLFRVEFSSLAHAIAGAWHASSTMFHCLFLKEQEADHNNVPFNGCYALKN